MSGDFSKQNKVDYTSKIGSIDEIFIYPLVYNGISYPNYKISNMGYI